jgi:hypothetical protein
MYSEEVQIFKIMTEGLPFRFFACPYPSVTVALIPEPLSVTSVTIASNDLSTPNEEKQHISPKTSSVGDVDFTVPPLCFHFHLSNAIWRLSNLYSYHRTIVMMVMMTMPPRVFSTASKRG